MRIENTLKQSRYSLSDPAKTRWTDERLLELLDTAQKDIAYEAKVLRDRITIPLIKGQSTYVLPDTLMLSSRVVYEGKRMKIRTHEEIDAINCTWEDKTGETPEIIVFEKTDKTYLKVYPIPLISSGFDTRVTVPPYTGNPAFGLYVGITDYTFDSDFGVIVNLIDDDGAFLSFNSEYGTLTTTSEITPSLIVYYYRKPLLVTSTTDTLEIPDMYDTALKYFIVASALLDNMNAQNIKNSGIFFEMYSRELQRAADDGSKDFAQQPQRQFKYNSFV